MKTHTRRDSYCSAGRGSYYGYTVRSGPWEYMKNCRHAPN